MIAETCGRTIDEIISRTRFAKTDAAILQLKDHRIPRFLRRPCLQQGGGREMEMNLNKLSEIEHSDWPRAISSKRDVAYGLAPKRLLF